MHRSRKTGDRLQGRTPIAFGGASNRFTLQRSCAMLDNLLPELFYGAFETRPQEPVSTGLSAEEELMNCGGLTLNNSFIHLPGISRLRERALWKKGILDWSQFLEFASAGKLSEQIYRNAVTCVCESLRAMEQRDVSFFSALLPDCDLWRLYPEFADETLFLDIETTGLAAANNVVTLIATFSNRQLALFVDGINMADFPSHIAHYPLLVTFNGSQFDLPFLRTHFPAARLDMAHIDLRFLLASLGYKGGLKAVERALGLRREPSIENVTGQDAPSLWCQYRRGDEAALEVLALYNLTDAAHLAQLLTLAVREKTQELKFLGQTVFFESQMPLQPCREYLSKWLTKYRGHDCSAVCKSSRESLAASRSALAPHEHAIGRKR